MPMIKNNTARPFNLSLSYRDANGVLKGKNFYVIPTKNFVVSEEQLTQLKSQVGFQRYMSKGFLTIINDKEPAPAKSESNSSFTISKTARELAEKNGIDLNELVPNENKAITVAMVEEAIKSQKESSNEEL
jgi:hypothetical protein